MRHRFLVDHGKVIPTDTVLPAMKRCRTCNEVLPLNERHFKKKRNSMQAGKGWEHSCLVCSSKRITKLLGSGR